MKNFKRWKQPLIHVQYLDIVATWKRNSPISGWSGKTSKEIWKETTYKFRKMENIKGKVVIITGASSGIGEETARILVQNGAKIVLSARREERLKTLVNEFGTGQAVYLKSDVTNLEDMKSLVSLAKECFGRVDVLFANAGIMPAGNLSELKVDDWMSMIETNIKGVLMMKKFLILAELMCLCIGVGAQGCTL